MLSNLNDCRSDKPRCLKDTPRAWEDGFGRTYYEHPGYLYGRSQQCKFSFGENATYCNKERSADADICHRLWCDDKQHQSCVTTYTGAADGTSCDAPSWLGRKVCQIAELPAFISRDSVRCVTNDGVCPYHNYTNQTYLSLEASCFQPIPLPFILTFSITRRKSCLPLHR